MSFAEPSIDDDERPVAQIEWWKARDGQQSSDPTKLAEGDRDCQRGRTPRRLLAGEAAVELTEEKAAQRRGQGDADRARWTSMAHDDAER